MKTVDISGTSGPYENACQTMLRRFLKWSEEKSFDEIFPEVGEKRTLDPEIGQTLRKMVEDIDPSGAMWGATLSHFAYIKRCGYQDWLEFGRKENRIIDWSEDDPIHFSSPEEAFKAGCRLGEKMRRED